MTTECLSPQIVSEFSDEELRALVRAKLPTEVFRRRPWRLMYVPMVLGLIVASGWVAMHSPWYVAIPVALFSGHCYSQLMFFAHEVAHGAVTGSRRLQDIVLYLASMIYCLSPKLWRVWHNSVHHGHANVDIRDPDHFGTTVRYEQSGRVRRFIVDNAPGSGRLISLLYPFIFFTGQIQGVFWVESVGAEDFRPLDRRRARIETFVMMLFWIAFAIATGWRGALYLVLLPMLIANFMVMSYIFTNHLLRPLKDRASALDGTMSVTTIRPLDLLHFHFSHHIEHHLFPSMGSNHYPRVRKAIQEIAGDRYLAPPHWWALKVLYSTPRVYELPTEFIEPVTGRRVSVASVEELLAAH